MFSFAAEMRKKAEIKNNVADCCLQLFIKQGIRSVSVEEIVRACNISKKTLYELFGNKEGVVRETLEYDCNSQQEELTIIAEKAENAIDEMFQLQKYISNRFMNLNPALIFDLTKYYNTIFRECHLEKQDIIIQFLEKNLNRGIREGHYRANLPKDIVSKLWLAKSEMVRDQEIFPLREYPMEVITRHLVELHLRSIATTEGIAEIDNQLNNKV